MLNFFYVLVYLIQFVISDLIVNLPDGKIRGLSFKIQENRTIYKYRGIPFATPPLGKLRFLPPHPVKPWNGVLNATQDGASCVSFGGYPGFPEPENQSEDCLFINVFTPTRNTSANLSVMVWIYGGGFMFGTSTTYDPEPFFGEDVIIITFNYRLGTLGFLSTEDKGILGNAGLKDQLLALKWTQTNIGFFGGDPNKVTIFGESAGGMSVGFHILSKKSSGLFRAAICQSGNSLTYCYQKSSRIFSYQLARSIDPSITAENSSFEIRDFLQNQPVELLLNLTYLLGQELLPVIEVEDRDAFLTKPNYYLLQNGNINRVPLILGHNSEETASYFPDVDTALQTAKAYDQNLTLLIPHSLKRPPNANLQDIAQDIRTTYIGENGLFQENLAIFLEWFSDNEYVRSTIKHAELQSQYTSVYYYQFSFYGTTSKNHVTVPGAGKVGHADDLGYIFNITEMPIKTEADFLTRSRLVKLWTNFAKSLNPIESKGSDVLQNVSWEKVTPEKIQFLDISESLQMKPNRKENEMRLWDYIWNTYGKRPFITF